MALYAVFQGREGTTPRPNSIGQPILCTRLRNAIGAGAQVGDTILRWGNGGQCTGRYRVTERGTIVKLGDSMRGMRDDT